VPRWSRQKHCFLCHNNGDAARALFRAAQAASPSQMTPCRYNPLAPETEHGTTTAGEGPFSDKRLARVAFTAALATAVSTGKIKDRKALLKAAEQLALDSAGDGSWAFEGDDAPARRDLWQAAGHLLARESLAIADPARFRSNFDRAAAWLEKRNFTRH